MHFYNVMLMLFCDFSLKWWMCRSTVFASSFASNLARVWQKLKKCLNKYLVMTLWVRCKPMTGLIGFKMAERQLMIINGLDDLQLAQHWKNVAKVHKVFHEGRSRMIHDVCNVVGLSYRTCQRILSDKLNVRQTAENSCQGCCLITRSNIDWKWAWNLPK
jgi:hypothetical protein